MKLAVKKETSIASLLYLSILESIKKHGCLPKKMMSKSLLQYYVSRLKNEGKIKRIGYGTWTLIEPPKTSIASTMGYSLPLPPPTPEPVYVNDAFRLHNIVFLIKVNRSWLPIINNLSINYSIINKGVYKVVFNGVNVWLCQGRVVVYVPPGTDFKGLNLINTLQEALSWFYTFIGSFEGFLGVSLRSNNILEWSFSRKHISLVRNALVDDLAQKRLKLRVYDNKGLWLLTDFSFQNGELEGIRNADNVSSMMRIKAFFNNIKDNPHVPLPSETYELILALTTGLAATKSNLDKVAEVLKEIKGGNL